MTASSFDDTELRTIMTMFIIGGSVEGAVTLLKRLKDE